MALYDRMYALGPDEIGRPSLFLREWIGYAESVRILLEIGTRARMKTG